MTASNIKFFPDLNWDSYCKTEGYSFSWLKNEGAPLEVTNGIKIGKLIHTYLLKPAEYDWSEPEIIMPIAKKLIDFKIQVNNSLTECAMTCDLEHEGLTMKWKGMADDLIKKLLVIDYKVIAGDLDRYIKMFFYDHQIRGYMFPPECPDGLIIAFNKKIGKVQTAWVKPDPRWWIYKIKQYGQPSS